VRRPAGAKAKRATGTGRGPPRAKASKDVPLLSGGNPQIGMANGDAPVQAYIAHTPGWKRDVGQRLSIC
jgi:hypothetical protein